MSNLALDEEWHFSKPWGNFSWLFPICLHHHDLYPWSSHGEQTDSCRWYFLSYQWTAAACLHCNVMVHVCVRAPRRDRSEGTGTRVLQVLGSSGKCRWSLFTGAGVHYTLLLGWTHAWECCAFWETILGKKNHQGPLNPCIFILNFFFVLLTCSCLLWSHTVPLGFSKLWVVLNNVSVVKYAAST